MFTFSMLSRSSYPGPPLYLPLIRDSRKGESLRLSVEQSARNAVGRRSSGRSFVGEAEVY